MDKISQAEASAKNLVKKSAMELKVDLLRMMKPGENVVQTMRRLSGKSLQNNKIKKRTPKSGQNGKNGDNDPEVETKEQKLANKVALERFTELADELLSTGMSGVIFILFARLCPTCNPLDLMPLWCSLNLSATLSCV